MKKLVWVMVVGCLFVVPELAQAQVDKMFDRFSQQREQRIGPEDLRIVQMQFSPDPVRQGQQVSFRITIVNDSPHSWRITLVVEDRDKVVSEARDVNISPGENRIDFPAMDYRFSLEHRCFTVDADIERTRLPTNLAKEFCARRTSIGWTMGDRGIGPLYVEDLDTDSDPSKSAHINFFRDSSIMKLFSDEGFPIVRDESDARNRFSFAIDINGKINLIANLTSWTCLFVGYRVGHDQIDFQPVSPLFSMAQSNKNVLYHGPFVEVKFRW